MLIVILMLIIATGVFYGGVEAFVAFNLWLGELLGMGYK